ncbi:hypothetical protein A3H65_00095 [Candidatus Giovannonibacteria bacterium RIFCSPLOWO2_02_FULL_45_14]|nr:MAG: hypothetical protein A3C75_00640 [Candidatus Giovannonibacteria bacterium RIFCSPHIGHO2_02_FULL_44_31]OGF76221.1 MAG: hypothetical protein A3E62_03760 [Candidatus Giovannonibacteria bacterium RIFCSPHIGHO2_12_FULL_44_29]OGF91118.1 MAG: hypothetical protein A3H65_00095 [Candidatus Giovannonibacteria bacterium RIFCSPLOWO2_02_FULL_45_14]
MTHLGERGAIVVTTVAIAADYQGKFPRTTLGYYESDDPVIGDHMLSLRGSSVRLKYPDEFVFVRYLPEYAVD